MWLWQQLLFSASVLLLLHQLLSPWLAAGECIECCSGELDFFTLPNCWEHFGFDLLVDQSWHVWLLEANAEPDFRWGLGAASSCLAHGFVLRCNGLSAGRAETA